MKSVSTLKFGLYLFALAVLSVPAVIAVSIPQQIEELKMDYERKTRLHTSYSRLKKQLGGRAKQRSCACEKKIR
jgi:uncharacterized protein VirK/YbjX